MELLWRSLRLVGHAGVVDQTGGLSSEQNPLEAQHLHVNTPIFFYRLRHNILPVRRLCDICLDKDGLASLLANDVVCVAARLRLHKISCFWGQVDTYNMCTFLGVRKRDASANAR